MVRGSITVENLVVSARIAGHVDIDGTAHRFSDAEYHPERLEALIFKERGATVLVFPDGSAVVTGPRSIEDAHERLDGVRLALAEAGVAVHDTTEMAVENAVVSTDLDTELALDQCALALEDDRVGWSPSSFPGLVYRMRDPEATVLAFATGKVVATECDDLDACEAALGRFVFLLEDRGLVPPTEASLDEGAASAV